MSDILAAHGIDFQLPDAQTVTDQQTLLYGRSQEKLRNHFTDNCLKGSLTFDGWSSSLRKFNGVTFHYLDLNFEPQCHVIGFVEYDDHSTAEILSKQVGKEVVIFINDIFCWSLFRLLT